MVQVTVVWSGWVMTSDAVAGLAGWPFWSVMFSAAG